MRTFIAIEIPGEIKEEMAKIQEQLKHSSAVDAGWTRPEGIHLTLKFLGEAPEANVPEIMNVLTGIMVGVETFSLDLAGVGTFPNPASARVVWVGIGGETDRLLKLQAEVEDGMARLGFERENRKFTPHLTLGRIKYIRSRKAWLGALEIVKDIRFPSFVVNAISLMKSELKPSGAAYTELGKIEMSSLQHGSRA